MAFLVTTATFLPMPSLFRLEDLMRAAAMNLAACKASAWFRLCFSAQTRRHRTQLRMRQLLPFIRTPLWLIPMLIRAHLVSTIQEYSLTRPAPNTGEVAIISFITLRR